MKDISIEYAHIYTNHQIGREHELSINVLGDLIKNTTAASQTTTLAILIDDYSFPDPTFDYENFSVWLSEKGYKPDVIMRESQLIPLCDEVLQAITNQKLKDQLIDYIKSKKYPCSLFIATWYMLRLGHIQSSIFNRDYCAKSIISILPESFKPFEDKGLEIIHNSTFTGAEARISHRYIEGRLIA